MIHTARITSGYASKLPALAGKTFKFNSGLNVLFGPNGCGKTSLLRIVAAYTGCENPGWSTLPAPGFGGRPKTFPEAFRESAPGECEAVLEWDGQPCYLQKTDIERTGMLPDFEDEIDESIRHIFAKPSSGQTVIGLLNGLRDTLSKPPDMTDLNRPFRAAGHTITHGKVNDLWQVRIESFVGYFRSFPKPKKPTLTVFIDEPDRSLSIPNQAVLWSKALSRLTEDGHQVIVASHSPFVLLSQTNKHVIEMADGYVQQCRDALEGKS